MIGRSLAGPWWLSLSPIRPILRAAHCDRQRLANNVKGVSEGPALERPWRMKNSPPHHLNAASIDRSRLAQRSVGDGERTKAVLLLIDCKISRASQWDQRKTAADGAGPDTLVERALPTC
ncbi:unnamed protein product [Leuciscus chuanchicus]